MVRLRTVLQPGARSMYSRIMRLAVPLIMISFTLVGLALALINMFGARDRLVESQRDDMNHMVESVSTELNHLSEDVVRLASNNRVREFARASAVNATSLNEAQVNLLNEFTLYVEQHTEVAAIHYVTYAGVQWSSVNRYDGQVPVIETDPERNEFLGDRALATALSLEPGGIVIAPMEFLRDPETQVLDRVEPYLRLATPVTIDQDLNSAGAIVVDVFATSLIQEFTTEANTVLATHTARRILLTDAGGFVLADTGDTQTPFLRSLALGSGVPLNQQVPVLGNYDRVERIDDNIVDLGTVMYSVESFGLEGPLDINWQIVIVDDQGVLRSEALLSGLVLVLGAVATGLVVTGAMHLILRRVLQPIERVQQVAQNWINNTGELPPPSVVASLQGMHVDEVDQLLQAFHAVDDHVRQINAEMDTQLNRYARNLDIAARISRETATLYDIDRLLNRAISLICQEYGFYHAQVFLVDDIGKNAVLTYSYGDVGQKLLEQGHKLEVGSASVIGRVTQTGLFVLVHDTTEITSGTHKFNPLLPDTRTELALPLQVGSPERGDVVIIGALDIQHNTPNIFREDEIRTFQLLADQIALAVQNARLLVEMQARVEQIDALNRQLTAQAWDVSAQSTEYHYDLLNIKPGAPTPTAPVVSTPIVVRGQVIGSLDATVPDAGFYSEGDYTIMRAVADRVAIAIENARLFEETQSSLQETSVLYQLGRYLNEANSQEGIIQGILTSVMPDALGGQIGVLDEYMPSTKPVWLEITADVALVNAQERDVMLLGMQLRIAEHTILREIKANQIVLISDVERDQRLDDVFRAILSNLNARAMVIIPFSVRGVWRGVIMVQFPEAREFTEREGRIFTTLIDQAGVAIDNRMLLQQNELALEQIERLYSASRITNMAQSFQDLIRAAINVSNDATLNFELGVLEGALDETGWPTQFRLLAHSRDGNVFADDQVYELQIAADSPLRYREPQLVVDRNVEDTNVSSMVRYIRARDNRFGAAFPLFSANQPIAILFITADEPRDLPEEDYDIYRALTGQISTVVQNRRLLEQTAQALDETRRLYAASRAIAAALDAATVYDAAARYLALPQPSVRRVSFLLAGPLSTVDAAYVEVGSIWMRDPDATAELQVGYRIPSAEISFPGILEEVETGALRFNSTQAIDHLPALQTLLQGNGCRSASIAQMRSRQKWFGVILVESDREGVFDEQYERFLIAIADQIAIALDSLQSFNEAQQQARRALALAEAGQLAAQIGAEFARSIGEVFLRVAEAADYDRWVLALVDDSGQRLEFITYTMPGFEAALFSEESGTYIPTSMEGYSLVDAFRLNRMMLVNLPAAYPGFANFPIEFQQVVGKHIAAPIRVGGKAVGALSIGRRNDALDLDERDEQLVNTLAAQVGVAVENRRLFLTAQTEQQTLRSILATLPAGVIVLDPETLKPVQTNPQAEQLLAGALRMDEPFTAAVYNMYRTGTATPYPDNELPISVALETRAPATSDDVTIEHPDGYPLSLLINAAPILNDRGEVSAVVVAFQDITTLRALEDTLQSNLRETIVLYEMTRALTEADEIDNVLDETLTRLTVLEPSHAYIIMLDDENAGMQLVRSMEEATEFPLPDDVLDAQRPIFVDNIANYKAFSPDVRAQLQAEGIVTLISLPMRSRSRRDVPLGWLVMTFNHPTALGLEREQFLTTLADTTAVALDNRYLFNSTQTALQETATLYSATTAISRAQDPVQITEALQGALETLQPNLYAAYEFQEGELRELFNIGVSAPPAPFRDLIERHHLLSGPDFIFQDDLTTLDAPDPFESDLLALGNIGAVAVVLLLGQEGANGLLIMAYHKPHRFTNSEGRYLGAVADSASLVVSNNLLFEQIEATLQETRILYQASRALNDAANRGEIVQAIVDHLPMRPVNLVFMAVLTHSNWKASDAMVQIVAAWQPAGESGLSLEGVSLSAEQYPAWGLLASSTVRMIDDVTTDDSLDPMERIGVESLDLRSMTIVPLRVTGRDIGAIVIGAREPYRHTDRDVRIYQSFSEQASLRMEASRLLAQTERRSRQLVTSAQVSQIASSILDLSFLLPRIVDLIKEAFSYDHVQIFLMDDEDDYAVLRASTGAAGQQLLSINHKLRKGSASVIGQVTALGEPFIALDTADARVVHRPNPYLPNTRSEMAIPLKLKGKVVGALDVQSNQPNAYDEDDISVLTTLAAQISVAIDNAQLFDQARRRATEMSFLFSVTTAAAAAESLTEALQSIANELRESLDSLSVSLYLPQAYTDGQESIYYVMQPVALSGTDQPLSELSEIRLDASRNVIATAANQRRPILLGNLTNEPSYLPVVAEARSAAIVPLAVGGQLIGLITMEGAQVNAFNEDTLTLLLTLAGTLSAIVQNQQLLETVQQTNEQLRELDRLKSDFLANMSHELRTPLNSIIGFSRVILKGIDGPLTEMQEQDLSTIYNSGQHLLNLINDILDQAKIAAGKMDLEIDYFDLKAEIDRVRSIGIGLVKDKPIDIYVDIEPNLPKAYGDGFRTRQVMLNLISNAAKFTREGSIAISVYKTRDHETGRLMLRVDVADTGIGIAEKDLPMLFEAFRQVDSSLTRTVGGTGLGLPIAKSLIEMQGGQMIVQSQVDVGSTFSIMIPTQPVDKEQAQIETQEITRTQEITPVSNGKDKHGEMVNVFKDVMDTPMPRFAQNLKRQILLIEDNPDMVDQFRRILQRENYEIYTAAIPLEAEAMVSGLRPTLVVMDVNFANGEGWNVLERLKARDDTGDIPIVVVSLSAEVERAQAMGVFRFVRRPFMPEDLVDAVREAERDSRTSRILIIDDQPESVRLLQQVLGEQNSKYRVFTASSGSEGIAQVARRRPDLIILDLRMPDMDGFEVIRELRGNPETGMIPILVVTGEALTPAERDLLSSMEVISKTDVSGSQPRVFMDSVKSRLSRMSGEPL
jgi:GAF domain-containing protein/DNA-binding response OmpR family regulator